MILKYKDAREYDGFRQREYMYLIKLNPQFAYQYLFLQYLKIQFRFVPYRFQDVTAVYSY